MFDSQALEVGKPVRQHVWLKDSMTQIRQEYKGAIVLTVSVQQSFQP